MNSTKSAKPVSFFTRIMWFAAGVETETLLQCPLDYKKYEAIGLTIVMTSLVGFGAGASAAWYFTQDGLWTLLFAAFWSVLIFSIDRSLVVTLKKDPYKKSYYVFPLIARALLATLVAGIMSIPLELLVFNGFIQNDIESYKSDLLKQQQEDSFDAQQASEYDSKAKSLQETLSRDQDRISDLTTQISSKRSEIQVEKGKLDNPNTSTYNNARVKVNTLQGQVNALSSLPPSDTRRSGIAGLRNQISIQQSIMSAERTSWNSKVKSRINDLEKELGQLESSKETVQASYEKNGAEKNRVDSISSSYENKAQQSLDKTDERFQNGNNFTLYYGVLSHALYKKHNVQYEVKGTDGEIQTYEREEYANQEYLFLLWFIRAIFFIIELLPSIVKIASKPGQYDLRVYHLENELKKYLQSQEYQDYCHEMLHGDSRLEQELQEKRHESERQVQERIIKSIMTAEESVAQDCIDNWEKIEKAKLRGQAVTI